jgi:hypothetical protein
MKRLYFYCLLFLLAATTFVACRTELPDLNRPGDEGAIAHTFSAVFQSYWEGMNNNYMFWDIDPTDWDAVYTKYMPLFEQLNINDSTHVMQGFRYFEEMTANLVDGHYKIDFNNVWLKDSMVFPIKSLRIKEPGFHALTPADIAGVITQYINPGTGTGATSNTGFGIITGILDDNILYLYFSNFEISENIQDENISNVYQLFFDYLHNLNLKGLIIDIRGNGGGAVADLTALIRSIIAEPVTIGYTQTKLGDGRFDYSPNLPYIIEPASDAVPVTAPIVVLADRRSVSCAEVTTMAIASLPNGYFVGERTWGGQGELYNEYVTAANGGTFNTQFMKLVYTPFARFRNLDGNIYEGVGFPPDVEVKFDAAAFVSGKDVQLEAAIKLIHEQ